MYTLLDCFEVETDNGETVRLVKLRNPWSNREWDGDWCDSSDLWTDQLREQLHVTEEEDGIFFMSFDDYLQRFESTDFCMNLPNAKLPDQSYKIKGKPAAFFEFEID